MDRKEAVAGWSKKSNRSVGRPRLPGFWGGAFALTVCPQQVLQGPAAGVLGGRGGGRVGGGRPLLRVEGGLGRWLGDQVAGGSPGNRAHRVLLATLTSVWDCLIQRRVDFDVHRTLV